MTLPSVKLVASRKGIPQNRIALRYLHVEVELAQRGDRDAFGRLFTLTYPRLFRFCCHLTKNPEQARDLAQDTFLKALTRIEQLSDSNRFLPWLFRMAKNRHVDLVRCPANRTWSPLEGNEAEWEAAAPAPAPLNANVEKALASLQPDEQRLLRLVDLEENTYAEAGKIVGISPEAARSRLRRIRQDVKRRAEHGFAIIEVAMAGALLGIVLMGMTASLKHGFAGVRRAAQLGQLEAVRQAVRTGLSCEKTLSGDTPSGFHSACHTGVGEIPLLRKNGQPLFTDNPIGEFELQATCPGAPSAHCGCAEAGCGACASEFLITYRPVGNAAPKTGENKFRKLFPLGLAPCAETVADAETAPSPIPTAAAEDDVQIFSGQDVEVLTCKGTPADNFLEPKGISFFKSDLCAGVYVAEIYFPYAFGEVPQIQVSAAYTGLNSPTGCLGQTTDRIIATWEPLSETDGLTRGFRIKAGSSPTAESIAACKKIAEQIQGSEANTKLISNPEEILKMDGFNSPMKVNWIAVGKKK